MACGAPAERLWFWRHQLPRGARRIHSRQAERKRQASVAVSEIPSQPRNEPISMSHAADVSRTDDSSAFSSSLQSAVARSAGDRRRFRSRAGRASARSAEGRCRRAGRRLQPRRLNRTCARPSAWPSTTPMPPNWRTKPRKALKALAANQPALWKALRAQGIFRGHGPAPKVAFLYTGQGSQYVNMLRGASRHRTDCGRNLRRSRSRDDSLARQAAQRIYLR